MSITRIFFSVSIACKESPDCVESESFTAVVRGMIYVLQRPNLCSSVSDFMIIFKNKPSRCAVLAGIPVVGMAIEFLKPDFDIEKCFEELGEHFVINMGPAGGYELATRSAEEIRYVLAERSDIFKMEWPGMLPLALILLLIHV